MRVGNYRTTDWHEYHMLNPKSVVPGSIMPAYKHMFSNTADIETAYAEAYTVKTVFNVPYDKPDMPKLGTFDDSKKEVMAQAAVIVADMKSQEVKEAFKKGEIKEIVAIIAYLNSLK
jgi:cytochrome c oxidase cbb3-type subunit 2